MPSMTRTTLPATSAWKQATAGDMDDRGPGQFRTLIMREYLEASRWKRQGYRLARNPLVLLVRARLCVFLIHQSFPFRAVATRERMGMHRTNGALLAIAVAMSLTVGIKAYVLIQTP